MSVRTYKSLDIVCPRPFLGANIMPIMMSQVLVTLQAGINILAIPFGENAYVLECEGDIDFKKLGSKLVCDQFQ